MVVVCPREIVEHTGCHYFRLFPEVVYPCLPVGGGDLFGSDLVVCDCRAFLYHRHDNEAFLVDIDIAEINSFHVSSF